MRLILLTILLCLSSAGAIYGQVAKQPPQPTGAPAANPSAYVRPDKKTRLHRYFKSTFGLEAIGENGVIAGFATWTNSPNEWGTHWDGFGKRFASNMGKDLIGNTTQFALEEAFKLDSHYYRSQKRNAGSKIKNALISPFTARDKNGKLVFGYPRIVGTYAAGIIATETWYPKRYGLQYGLQRGTISLGTSMLFNLVKEFLRK